jgi:hypothetical protein
MHGLFDVDITTARNLLSQREPPLSLTAFIIASIGRAAAAHPQVHAYRDWRGRLVEHRFVDVQTLIEIPTSEGPFGLVHVAVTPTFAASQTSPPRSGRSKPTPPPLPPVAC